MKFLGYIYSLWVKDLNLDFQSSLLNKVSILILKFPWYNILSNETSWYFQNTEIPHTTAHITNLDPIMAESCTEQDNTYGSKI